MRTLTYYEQRHVIEAFGQFVANERDIAFSMASNAGEVEAKLDELPIDGIIVPRVSIPTWWDVEAQLAPKITVPRIVAVTRDPGWTPSYVNDLGFDGLLTIDFEASPRQMVDDIVRLVTTASTRGARPPLDRALLDAHPELDEVTDGDPLNLQILSLLAIGRVDREIARSVFLSPQTVRNRVSAMLQRSGMRNRTELTLLYLHRSAVKRERETT